jgi:predicted nucleic acid-binding protein
MICLDTTFLIDLWRGRKRSDDPAQKLLRRYSGEILIVPIHAAGEFLEGAACVSEERLQEALPYLRMFQIESPSMETSIIYARIVVHLRTQARLEGVSKADMWIAAIALQHGAELATRNRKHFKYVPNLTIVDY